LARFARLAGEPGQVRFLGSRRDVGRLLGAADVYWHAGDEGSAPIAVVEAMAAGVPVVADDTPGCRQALTDGADGRLCPAGARAARGRATEHLLADASYRGRLADAARETAGTRFSADRMADDYARAYRRLLA
ncbi:MAG: glycosyltransferase, partial [Planctomycetota bacterium]